MKWVFYLLVLVLLFTRPITALTFMVLYYLMPVDNPPPLASDASRAPMEPTL